VTGGTLELGTRRSRSAADSARIGGRRWHRTLTISGAFSVVNFGNYAIQTGGGTTVLNGATSDAGYIALDNGRTLENAGTFT